MRTVAAAVLSLAELTKRAAGTARDGDCSTIASTADEVRTLDADFHDTVFVR